MSGLDPRDLTSWFPFILIVDRDLTVTWASPHVRARVPDAPNASLGRFLRWQSKVEAISESTIRDAVGRSSEMALTTERQALPILGSWYESDGGFVLLARPSISSHEDMAGFEQVELANTASIADLIGARREAASANRRISRATQELAEREEFVRSVLTSLPVGVMLVDAETHKIISINRAVESMTQRSSSELIGKLCHGIICPNMKGACPITDLKRTIDRNQTVALGRDGRETPILKTVCRIRLQGRDIFLETFMDISERVQAEEAMHESRERYRLLFEHAAEGILVVDCDAMRIVQANPAASKMFGYDAVGLFGIHLSEIVAGEEKPVICDQIRGKAKGFSSIECQRKDGSLFRADVNMASFRLDGRTCGVSLFTDVTQLQEVEVQAKQA